MSRAWPELLPIPAPTTALVDPSTGRLTKDWYRYFSATDALLRQLRGIGLGDLADVTFSGTPAEPDVLIYSDGLGYWTNFS